MLSQALVWTDPLTGDSKHTLQTFQSTMSIRQMASMIQMQSREHTLITIRTYLIFILQILPAMEQSFLLRQQMTPVTSSSTEMQYSIRMVPGNMAELSKTYSDDELAMIPIYFGVDDENEGLATGTENFWCVNKEASEEDIQATLDFMNWCVTSEDRNKGYVMKIWASQFLSKQHRNPQTYL